MKPKLPALLVALVLAGVSAFATVVVPAEFREVVSDAELIVRGLVTDVRSFVVPGDGIDTVATVSVETVLKGQADSFVSVRVPGGEVGSTKFVMVGAPTFKNGDRAVFFLKRTREQIWRPIGLTMGVYRVQAEPGTGRAVVQPPAVPTASRTATSGTVVRGDPQRKLLPVSEFESLVKLVMSSPPAQAVPRGGRQ